MTPQAELVLDHLQVAGSITNVEAHAVHKVRSVSRRITEIVRAGYTVTKQFHYDATGQRYLRYSLVKSWAEPLHVRIHPASSVTAAARSHAAALQ